MTSELHPTALVVDDDEPQLTALSEVLRTSGFEIRRGSSLKEAREALGQQHFDLVLLDLQLPDGPGLELLLALEGTQGTEVVVITGHASVETAIDALRAGVNDYLTKPIDLVRLRLLLRKVSQSTRLRRQVDELRGELRRLGRFGALVGSSDSMQAVYDQIQRVAPTEATVLVTGETGTGKELVAQTIHRLSGRWDKPFVDLNCGAVAPNLIEAELFGHERGSFTGATRSRAGIFERANGGSLLLDEITEMPADLQVRLLRVLETRQLRRVGGDQDIQFDVRIIAATNRDPAEAVREGTLREDLMYRLMVFPIALPPLRERGRDVELIAQTFLDELNRKEGTERFFSEATLAT